MVYQCLTDQLFASTTILCPGIGVVMFNLYSNFSWIWKPPGHRRDQYKTLMPLNILAWYWTAAFLWVRILIISKRKFLRCRGYFSRAQPTLSIKAVNRLFKSMFLPVLDYCGAVFHRCAKGNEVGLEWLQRRGRRIVLNTALLSTEQMVTRLGWKNLIVKLVEKCFKGMARSYFSKYFNLKDIIFMVMAIQMRTTITVVTLTL